jgi:hypothetical protein
VQLDARIVFIDADLDIALAKVTPPIAGLCFPALAGGLVFAGFAKGRFVRV